MSDGPVREIGRIQAGMGTRGQTLAVSVDHDRVLIGHPSGWPFSLNADQRKDFALLFHEAERQAEAYTEPSDG